MQLLEVVGKGGLGDIEQRHELAHAHLAGMLAEDVNELQAYRVAERLGDLGHAGGVLALDVGIDNGLAAALAGSALVLGSQLQIDTHRYTYID
jgi:hypothetical protein